jgi:uncharacterized iron-regulated membrane protein
MLLAAPPGRGRPTQVYMDPYSGRVLGTAADLRDPMRTVHQLHTHLLGGETGSTAVAWTAVALLLLAAGGIVLWWPRKIYRPGRPGKRFVFDLHNALGIWSWAFLLLFAATGAVVHWGEAAGPPPPRGTGACKGLPPASPDRLLSAAVAAVPGARPTFLFAAGNPARVIMKFPEDHTPAGRTNVYLEPCTAKPLAVQTSRDAPLRFKVAKLWNREVHTGDIFGWPTRILACLFSLSLPVMALTGPLLWWRSRARRSARG